MLISGGEASSCLSGRHGVRRRADECGVIQLARGAAIRWFPELGRALAIEEQHERACGTTADTCDRRQRRARACLLPGRYGAVVRRDDFIPPAPTDEAEFFRSAAIVLDTNVLLALYKLSATAREDALRAIESSADRLWLPHQVGVEFYRNHAAHRDMRSKAYQDAIKQTAQFERLATKDLGTGTTHEDLRKNVARVVREAVSGIDVEIQKLRDADAAITTSETDDVLERVEATFAGRVAAAPAPATIRTRTEEFTAWRMPGHVPPGFQDRGKTGTVRTAGDYLIWAEILEHAAANHLDILFVTEDGKDDWWEKSDGGRRPHRDLVLEFQHATGRNYHQVGMEAFVRLATSATGDEADQNTLNEIVAVGEETQEQEVQLDRFLGTWLAAADSRLRGSPGLSNATEQVLEHFLRQRLELDPGSGPDMVWRSGPQMDQQTFVQFKRYQSRTGDNDLGDPDDQDDDDQDDQGAGDARV